jgi:FkbM family methyltransferase
LIVITLLKRASSRLPIRVQQELKRLHFGRQIRKGRFETNEAEYDRLAQWVKSGDWVLDVGANVGHYAHKLSALVGSTGRVFAFEPVPQTFELLAANMARCPLKNVTLLNVAVSDAFGTVGMRIPNFNTGLQNYYMAEVTQGPASLSVVSLPIDSLRLPARVSLVKVDVEGHELEALRGMEALLTRDHPVLIVEGTAEDVSEYLRAFGYSFEKTAGSPNRVFQSAR